MRWATLLSITPGRSWGDVRGRCTDFLVSYVCHRRHPASPACALERTTAVGACLATSASASRSINRQKNSFSRVTQSLRLGPILHAPAQTGAAVKLSSLRKGTFMMNQRLHPESKRIAMHSDFDPSSLPKPVYTQPICDVGNDYRLALLRLTRCAWGINERVK